MSLAAKPPVSLDPQMIAAAVGLVVIGTIMIGSASISIADNATGQPFFYLTRHIGAVVIGLVGLAVAMRVPFETWYRLSPLILIAGFALLALPLLPNVGHTVNGASRWVVIGPVTMQPSEPARLCFLLYVASYCVRRHDALTSGFIAFAKPLALVGMAGLLLLLEPDFGAAVVLTTTTLAVVFVGGARLRDVTVAMIVAGAAFAALVFSADYRLDRWMSFRDPFGDPLDGGFQLVQSLIAIGRGDWFGVGLGESVQKLFYLPEAHTDFVFAVLAEELGLVGSTCVIALFGMLVYRAITLGQRSLDAHLPFQGLVAYAIGITLGIQAFINIGVNTGLLPTKGLTLPLLSYGRTSTVVTLTALGLLFRIHHELKVAELRRPKKRAST